MEHDTTTPSFDFDKLFDYFDSLNNRLKDTFGCDCGISIEHFNFAPHEFKVYASNADEFGLHHHERFSTLDEAAAYVNRICDDHSPKGKKKKQLEKLMDDRNKIDRQILDLAIEQ